MNTTTHTFARRFALGLLATFAAIGAWAQNSSNYDSEAFSLNNPTGNGYEFVGWTGNNANHSHGDLIYTANWNELPQNIAAGNNCAGMTFTASTGGSDKKFCGTLTGTKVSTDYYKIDETTINGIASHYTLVKNETLELNPTVTFNGAELDADNYTVSYTRNGEPVTELNTSGVYTLTISGNNANGYYGEKSILFAVITTDSSLQGDGSKNNPYLINNEADWYVLVRMVNKGENNAQTACYKLTADLTLGSKDNPIDTIVGYKNKAFKGALDGDFHTIHLYMSRRSHYAALFGYTDGVTIMNLTVDGTITSTHKFAAALIGWDGINTASKVTNIINCISSVHIICDNLTFQAAGKPNDCSHAGFVGQNEKGTMNFENCIFNGSITDGRTPKLAQRCAGFVSYLASTTTTNFRNCTMAGVIDIDPNSAKLANSTATFSRVDKNAKDYYYNSYYIHSYTDGKQQGLPAPTSTVDGVISRKYLVGNNTYYYVPAVEIDGYDVSYYGRKLTENVDYTITVADKDSDAELIFTGMGLYAGSNSKAAEKYTMGFNKWNDDNKTGWNAFSSPINGLVLSGTNLVPSNNTVKHNIYRYDEPTHYWQEYRVDGNEFNSFENGRGYIFRSEEELTNIEFNGEYYNTGAITIGLNYTEEAENLKGFNLIGNPYNKVIIKGVNFSNDNLANGYCTVNTDGTWQIHADNEAIPVATAILVQTQKALTLEMNDATAAPVKRADSDDNIMFSVSNEQFKDVALVEFNSGTGFNKMAHYNDQAPMLYINQNGENFALANLSDDTEVIDLRFKTMAMSRYTLNAKAQGSFSYLHLIDKVTGDDIDLLSSGSYSFVASTNDEADRFIVRFSRGANSSMQNDIFAYQSGNDVVVNGEGELQIFDLMGRMVMDVNVNGVQTVNVKSQGVYILKLNEKMQKIVVR